MYSIVLYDGDNLSDHNVLQLKMSIPVTHAVNLVPARSTCSTPDHHRHVVWRKASDEDLQNYKRQLSTRLQTMPFLGDCSGVGCDNACHQHISDYYDAITSACIATANACISMSSHMRPVAGWREKSQSF